MYSYRCSNDSFNAYLLKLFELSTIWCATVIAIDWMKSFAEWSSVAMNWWFYLNVIAVGQQLILDHMLSGIRM